MRSISIALVFAVAGVVSVAAPAAAHDDSCHGQRTCPADNHEYPWNGLSCASGAGDRRPEDQTPVDHGGVRYWCHTVVDQGMVPTTLTRPGVTSLTAPSSTTPLRSSSTTPNGSGVTTVPGPSLATRISACGDDRLTALAVAVPFGTPKAIQLSRFAALRRPATIAAGEVAVTHDWYTTSGTIVSGRSTPYGLAIVVRSADGRRVTAVIPNPACASGGSADVAARIARARTAIGRACGAFPVTGTVALSGKISLTGLGGWRAAVAGHSGPELSPVTAFAASGCRHRV